MNTERNNARLSHLISSFKDRISNQQPTIPSGFPSLDTAISGLNGVGLPPALYVVGGESSVGKTTLIQCIFDNIAKSGHDVLIFSLEMSADELIAKSISRESFMTALKDYPNEPWAHAYSVAQIQYLHEAVKCGQLQPTDKDAVSKLLEEYDMACDGHMYIYQNSIHGISVEFVHDCIKEHIANTNSTPVILIDYLQILKSTSLAASDKSNTDLKIQACAEICKEFKTPVFAISALNRAGYGENGKPSSKGLAAFKESGAIEYAADVAIMLVDKTPSGCLDEKKIEVQILKNRNGPKGGRLNLSFIPKFNVFTEATK